MQLTILYDLAIQSSNTLFLFEEVEIKYFQ